MGSGMILYVVMKVKSPRRSKCKAVLPETVRKQQPRILTTRRHLKMRKAARRMGRVARVRAVSMGEVSSMRQMPRRATTAERSAMLMLTVPADFISRVSCVHSY